MCLMYRKHISIIYIYRLPPLGRRFRRVAERGDGTGYLGGSNAARCCGGPSYGCGSVVAGAGTRHAAPGCAPLTGVAVGHGGSNVREGGNRYTIGVCFLFR